MGDRFVGRVSIAVDLLATPVPPPGWVEPAGESAAGARRPIDAERQRDELQGILAPLLEDPWLTGPDGRFCVLCGEIGEHADDCAVLRRDELLRRD